MTHPIEVSPFGGHNNGDSSVKRGDDGRVVVLAGIDGAFTEGGVVAAA
jgi:hypothetical protein